MQKMWKKALRNPVLDTMSPTEISTKVCVCSIHFTKENHNLRQVREPLTLHACELPTAILNFVQKRQNMFRLITATHFPCSLLTKTDMSKIRKNIFTDTRSDFSVRIVVADYYMAPPISEIDVTYSEFRASEIKYVSVLRVFGPSVDGRKACVHIHGVFPYFYIPCATPRPEPQLLYQIAASLDKALNISLKQASSMDHHVYKISLVKGIPFYGFHDKEHLFFKVFLYNPGLLKQAAELCQNGAILNQVFQPHEAHLNFTLQFFIDFNLFGMSLLHLQKVKHRTRLDDVYNEISPISILDNVVKRVSKCYYEVDCLAAHIINRQRIGKGDGIENPGLEGIWNEEMERRKQLNVSLNPNITPSQHRDFTETESHMKYLNIFFNKMSDVVEKPVPTSGEMQAEIGKLRFQADLPNISYPAENIHDSQLLSASDVTFHHSDDTFSATVTNTANTLNDSIVNESIVLNCTLTQGDSQVFLDIDDMELVDLLQDMDNQVEDDSILGTQSSARKQDAMGSDSDDSDFEYTQVFNEEIDLQEKYENNEKSSHKYTGTQTPWPDDSFWDGVGGIPQLDGAFDEDVHTKKVRKKGRMKFLGLSKTKRHLSSIKNKKTENSDTGPEVQIKIEESDLGSALGNNRKIIKHEEQDMRRTRTEEHNTTIGDTRTENKTKDEYKVEECLLYDIECDFEPQPGPSTMNDSKILPDKDIINSSMDSTPEVLIKKGNLGITSFYDVSHIFDRTLPPEEEDVKHDFSISSLINKNEKKLNISSSNESMDLDDSGAMKLRVTGSTLGSSKKEDSKTPATFQSNVIISPRILPPSRSDVISSLKMYDIPETKNLEPFYSDPNDVSKGIEVGQMLLKLSSNTTAHLKPFDNILKDITSIEEWRKQTFLQHTGSQDVDVNQLNVLLASNEKCILTPVQLPPSSKSVWGWLKDRQTKIDQSEASFTTQDYSRKFHDDFDDDFKSLSSSITNSGSLFHMSESPTKSEDITLADHVSRQPDGSFLCFGSTTKHSTDTPVSIIENDFLTVMTLEVLTNVRGDLHPDPLHDSIAAIFYTITNDCPASHFLSRTTTEAVVISSDERKIDLKKTGIQTDVIYVNSESDLINVLITKTKINDPDIICGYEIEMNSWGYVLERAQTLGINLLPEICRVPSLKKHQNRIDDRNFEGKVIGRIIFSVWRLLRHELAMSSYSFESTMYQILKERVPTFTYRSLYEWWNESTHLLKWMTVEYFLTKLSGTVRIMEKLDFINRTSELARLFGLQWWEVLSRGTQFRVESLMLRAARPLNLLALSPSVRQRAAMRAPECLPLIFEPKSRFYSDPVIVLDFQSLYPSMMIAYNYCFSTCIGKIQNMKGDAAYEMGAWQLRISKAKLEKLVGSNLVHWSPVGAGFVRAEARRGVLPALLTRILAARQAVKKSAKLQTDESVKKAMHSRQLGLKLIANVTYGYTAANFSGRMPCVEVGDSVVSKGRETLERAIKLVENNESWNAEVLYGDTDSMFVLVRGSRERAFEVGAQIAAAVTADNPPPVALKLEKVYQPCILQTKKRYVGFMYENPEQKQPQYEAKGIETVRRDGCPAGVKLLESVLCELFTSRDVSKVKRLVCDALSRLLEGRMPLSQLMFTREYNGPTGYRPGAHAPPLEIARRIARIDKRAVPLTASRVSWVVCAGAPGLPLMKLSHTAQEMFLDASLRPHVTYYITRVLLPPLARCLSLIGADVFQWYSEMPRRPDTGAGGIVAFLSRDSCASCGQRHGRATARRHGRATAICVTCQQRPDRCVPILMNKLLRDECNVQMCRKICMSCCSNGWSHCSALECPVLWRRRDAAVQLEQSRDVVQSLPLKLCDNTVLQF